MTNTQALSLWNWLVREFAHKRDHNLTARRIFDRVSRAWRNRQMTQWP